MCLRPFISNNNRFATTHFKFQQKLIDHYWSRLLRKYVPDLNNRRNWQKSNEEPDESNIVLKNVAARVFWPLGKIFEAQGGADGVTVSFDIQIAKWTVQRPAVTLSWVFPRFSNAPEVHRNQFLEKSQNQNKHYCAIFCLCIHVHLKCWLYVAGKVWEPISFILSLLLNTFIFLNQNFISWLMLFLLKNSEEVELLFQYYLWKLIYRFWPEFLFLCKARNVRHI